jgi:hypothetical protein
MPGASLGVCILWAGALFNRPRALPMNAIRRSIRLLCAMLVLSSVLATQSAQLLAGPINGTQLPTVTVRIGDSPNAPSWSYTAPPNDYRPATDENGGYELATPREFDILDNRAHVRIEELQFDPDPFVLNNILVTNTTTSTQIFSAFVGLPTTFGAPNLISGNVRTSVIDGGLDGATVATVAGQALYQAQIDFATVATLQNDPFSVSAPVGGSNTASATFGPNPNAIPVASNIGIQLRFTLTPGDTASILSRFDVVAIPEPMSAALIGIGLTLVSSIAGRIRRD